MKLPFPVSLVPPSPESGWPRLIVLGRPSRPFRGTPYALSGRAPRAPHYGISQDGFAPGGLPQEFPFSRDVLLVGHPDRTTILTWVRDGVSVYEFLLPVARGLSVQHPFKSVVFPGEKLPNRVSDAFHGFVAGEVATLVRRGCLVPF